MAGSTFNLSKKVCPATLSTKGLRSLNLHSFNLRALGYTSCAALSLLALAYIITPELADNSTHADSTITANIGDYYVNVTSTGTVNLQATPSVNGTLSSAMDTVTVRTNVPSGYELRISMGTTATDNKLHHQTITGAAFDSTSATTASPTTLPADTWGFAVPSNTPGATISAFDNTYTSPIPSGTSKWASVPLASNPILIQNTNTASTDGSVVPIYYAVNTDLALAAGAYTNTIMYTATIEAPTPGSDTTFTPASADAGTTPEITITTPMATTATIATNEVTATIGNNTCTVTNVTTNTDGLVTITCTAPNLTAGKYNVSVSIPKFGQTYTAAEEFEYIKPIMKMQDMTSSYCSNMTLNEQVQMQDSRDGKLYWVSKLADNNCWMTQNLDLDITTNGLTNADSDIGNPNSPNATAGTGGTITSDQATDSICPKGWRLPMSSGDPSFANLQTKGSLGSIVQNWLNQPYYFVRGGIMWADGDMLYTAGSTGCYWSSTPDSSANRAYALYFPNTPNVNLANGSTRSVGQAVRCVAR